MDRALVATSVADTVAKIATRTSESELGRVKSKRLVDNKLVLENCFSAVVIALKRDDPVEYLVKNTEWPHKFNESAAVAPFFLNGNHRRS